MGKITIIWIPKVRKEKPILVRKLKSKYQLKNKEVKNV